jgi:hypothetical protein
VGSSLSQSESIMLGQANSCYLLCSDKTACVQVWRYYLLSNRPEMSDTDFKWSDMRAKFNNELIANLGNFLNRALSFTASKSAPPPPPHTPLISPRKSLSGGLTPAKSSLGPSDQGSRGRPSERFSRLKILSAFLELEHF